MSQDTPQPAASDERADANDDERPTSRGREQEAPRRAPPPPTDWRQVERRQRRFMIALTALLAVAYFGSLIAYRGPAESLRDADARAYFAYLPSLVIDRDLDLSNQFAMIGPTDDGGYPYGTATNGYAANRYSVGPALLWLPGYLIGVIADRMAASFGIDTGPDGYGVGAIWGVALSSLVLAGFAADLSRRVAAQLRGPEYAMPATLLIWFGTAAIVHMLRGPIHPQSASWFCLALTLWLAWLNFRDDSKWWLWLPAGLAGGVMVGISGGNAVLLIVPGVLLLAGSREVGELRRAAVAAAVGFVIGYLPSVASLFLLDPGSEARGSFVGNLVTILVSPRHGWLLAAPLVAIGVVGLLLKAGGSRSTIARQVASTSLIAIGLMIALVAWESAGVEAAGLRFVAATPLLILGLTQVLASLEKTPGLQKPGLVVLFALAAANVWLLLG